LVAVTASRFSSPDLNRRAVRYDAPDFFHFAIGHGDAASSPIQPSVGGADPTEAVSNAVDHDVPTGIFSMRHSFRHIASFRIADVKGQVECASRIAPVDAVLTLGRAVVAFPRLDIEAASAKRNGVTAQGLLVTVKRYDVTRLVDNDSIGCGIRGQ